jgi:hypothetical protein
MVTVNDDSPFCSADYPTALRAIGRSLEERKVEDFELTCERANSYLVRIQSQASKRHRRTALQVLKRVFSDSQRLDHSAIGPELVYTRRDIERLERDGQLKRQGVGKPDPHSLPQALRAIGSYLQLKDARLRRLSRRGAVIAIEYETALDGCTTEEFTPSSVYALFVRRYVKRSDRRESFKESDRETQLKKVSGARASGLRNESWPEDEGPHRR